MKKKGVAKVRSASDKRKQSLAKKVSGKTPKPQTTKEKTPRGRRPRRGAEVSTGRVPVASRPLAPRRPTPEELALKDALEQFGSAVALFSNNEFSKARAILRRLATTPARDLAERARVYLRICDQKLSRSTPHLTTADDFYNQGVQLANQGNLEEAEENLKKALKLSPKCDYIHYAMATTAALRENNNVEEALGHLQKAIELNAQNRYLAQKDPDFSKLEEDPRFTEMLYPEKSPP